MEHTILLSKSSIKTFLNIALAFSTLGFAACVDPNASDDDTLDAPAVCSDEKCDAGNAASGFEVFEGADGKYYFHLVANNGQIVVRSQAYTTKGAAKRGTESVRNNGLDESNFRLLQARDGRYYFNLVSEGNHEIIATSQMYTRRASAARGIDVVIEQVAEAQRARAAATGGARFLTFRGEDHQYYFHVRGGNGEIMLQSEGYVGPAGIATGIASVRENAKRSANFDLVQAENDQYYFNLLSGNGEIIGHGETYSSRSNAERAIETLVSLFESELVADPTRLPTVPRVSLSDYPGIVNGFDSFIEMAGGEHSDMAYFDYAEGASIPQGARCETGNAAAAADAINGMIDELLAQGDQSEKPSAATVNRLRTELVDYLGTGNYKVCESSYDGRFVGGEDMYVVATARNGQSLAFTRGVWGADAQSL